MCFISSALTSFTIGPARSTQLSVTSFAREWNVWRVIGTQRCRCTDFSFDISTHSCSAKLLTDRHLKGSTWSEFFVISLVVTAWSFMNIWKRWNKNIFIHGGETFSFVFSYRELIFLIFFCDSKSLESSHSQRKRRKKATQFALH